MESWWKHQAASLPILTSEDKEEVVDLTGCIPLLLRALLVPNARSYRDALVGQESRAKYSEERERILGSKEFTNVQDWVVQFAAEQKLKLGQGEFIL
jgi:hypothetical protein